MGSKYLTDLADVLRAAGLEVKEYSNWQTRARGSGGYESGRPTHVMVHHTASPPSWSGQRDADYCAVQDEDAPLSNLCLDRDGVVWILAAGATNTNGKGQDTWGGGVPTDSMNSYAIGIEANGGYGESWPAAQTNAYVLLCQTLCRHYGIPNNNIRGHFEWAPTRKVDPAGPSPWASGSASWNMGAFRNECNKEQEDDDMPLSKEDIDKIADAVWTYQIQTTNASQTKNEPQAARYFLHRSFLIMQQYMGGYGGKPIENYRPSWLKQILDAVKK